MEHDSKFHSHCDCQHCVHYCSICDIVYCCKCGREWGRWNYSLTYGISTTPYITSGGGNCIGHTHTI